MNSTSFHTADLTATHRVSGGELCCDESVTCARGSQRCIGHELVDQGGTVVKSAMECAMEAHADLFDHRRGIWDCGDGISCLFDNDPYAHCAFEIETLRTLLLNAGCIEVGLATYPPAGHSDSTYTLAMLVRGDARTIFSVYETVDRQIDGVRAPQVR